jgi:sugar transferase (PEP-CTERM/EpsH1 system associated)
MKYLKISGPRRHVVHLVYSFTAGGLENVVLQLINHLPRELFRHSVIAITQADPKFTQRILDDSVEIIELKKAPGQPFGLYPKVYQLLRRLKPDVLHSCNLAALEFLPIAALSRVPFRVHAEHGMDLAELGDRFAKYRRIRKFYNPFVSQHVTVSNALLTYFQETIGIDKNRIHLISNGVDTEQFRPYQTGDLRPLGFPFQPGRDWVIGTVGRQVDIKNPMLLVEAFIALVRSEMVESSRMRLAMVGDGPLRESIALRLRAEGLEDRLWLPGVRSDVAQILRSLDCFVLPSLSEGTPCTLQEAMATGLPIVATDVGGNADLLRHGDFGSLVPSGDANALATAILRLCQTGEVQPQATAARAAVKKNHNLDTTIKLYQELFLNTQEVSQ